MPSREQRIATLVAIGIMPAEAERIVNDAEKDGSDLVTADQLALEDQRDGMALERSRLWWWYSPDVPTQYKRLLEARNA